MIAQRFLDAPWALLPSEMDKLMRLLDSAEAQALLMTERESASRPYDMAGSVAVISITGILMHGGYSWFGCGYDQIRSSFNTALIDPEAKAIALLIDSPGGEVAGCFDLADEIFAARDIKPIWSILDECAYSAAYALASAADVITVPRTGGTGSIGVVAMHCDMTKALDEAGLKITTVQYGARKTEQYPTAPLSKDARDRMQTEIDALGEMFVGMVARNRKMTADAVRKTEAGTFLGDAGIDAGLADLPASPLEAFEALIEEIS